MKHKPFKNWILGDVPLSKQEAILLKIHLKTCPHCQQLKSTWLASEQHFRNTSMHVPQPGFTQRWQSLLLYRHEHEKSKQTRRNLILLIAIMVMASAIYMLQNNLFTTWVVTALSQTTSLFFNISKILAEFNAALNRSPVLFYGFTLLTFGAILSLLTSMVFFIWNLLKRNRLAAVNDAES